MQAVQEKKDYKKRFMDLGISPDIIPTHLNYQDAYRIISRALTFVPKLIIKEAWQLMFFAPLELPLETLYEKYKDSSDNWGNTLIHYAGWVADMDVLEWFYQHHKDEFIKVNDYKRQVVHQIAWSGSVKALTWFKEKFPQLILKPTTNLRKYIFYSGNSEALTWFHQNCPEQFEKKDDNFICEILNINTCKVLTWLQANEPQLLDLKDSLDRNISCVVAGRGSVKGLQWLQQNHPGNLEQGSMLGEYPGFYAAQSGSSKAFAWFQANFPQQLLKKNLEGVDIICFAGASGSLQQLESALSFFGNPNSIFLNKFANLGLWEKYIQTLLTLLQRNYTLTRVHDLHLIEDINRKTQIQNFLNRNKEIKQVKMSFIAFLNYDFPFEMKLHILKCLLPPNVDEMQVYLSMLPYQRILFILKDTLRESVALEIVSEAFRALIDSLEKVEPLNEYDMLSRIEKWKEECLAIKDNQFFTFSESYKKVMPKQLKSIAIVKGILEKNQSRPLENNIH